MVKEFQKLDLLFINRSYWPDVEATGQLLTELCSDLARSHRVAVIAGQPNFVANTRKSGWLRRETHAGVEILRVGNRTFNKRSFIGRVMGLLSYLLLATLAAFRHRRPDVIIVETDPPVLCVLGAALQWWHRRPLVYYLQDLYPEVGLAMGRLKPGLLTAMLHWSTQLGLKRADRVIVLGEDMRQRILNRGIQASKIVIVPNWADTQTLQPMNGDNRLRQGWDVDGRLVVMYSGNLGFSQDLHHALQAARDLRAEPVAFVLIGEGAAKASLMAQSAQWALPNVRFLPYQPKERLAESLGAADVHLIPLQRGLAGYIVPSKLYGILAAGRPYVAALEPDSAVAEITRLHRTGLRVEPGVPAELTKAIRWCLANPDELRQMGQRGRRLAEDEFDRRIAVNKFDRILRGITKHASTASY
ncbi:MAG: glycosyltransferase family 4 protein [Gemmataceae bacterium]|nr:glycosyltransferase family 4 protein [Gemmataceae bacterium]